ncbi:Signal transduction histidine kinase [Georgenia satyanarayanai]|uniref:histidine kinase n=1 Tax=Georgenia satyanarayanai TaxID=860221 RepID=A0A2Y9A7A0_9MICO|nr:histidine kinase [Georgenia satyanarayanai]PYG00112.1 signal transduction histidine kinase [Georgenia satyanarayanai]SSA40135.1 Signal transduction histidine kinase [Georgenia satyanarayanai]
MGRVPGLVGTLRQRVRGTERARVVSDAVATFVAGLALLGVGLVGLWGGGPALATNRWWFVLTLVVMCAVMLAKARSPLPSLGAGVLVFGADALLGGSMGAMLGLLDLIYSAALRVGGAALRRLSVAVVLSVTGGAAATFVATGDLRATANVALLAFAVLGTPLWWGRSVRQQTELAALASARARDLARIGELREQEVVHAERTRMAGDLHDALASHLSAIAIHSEAALSSPRADDEDRAARRDRQALTAIRSASVAALREMRAMIDLLRTGDEARTSPARLAELDALTAGFRGQGMELTVSSPAASPELPAAVDQAAYRIVQESLANALKHGRSGPVDVTVAHTGAAVRVEVTNAVDDGAVPAAGTGVGLLTMRERAEALGGSFHAGPADGRWLVRATIPLEETP